MTPSPLLSQLCVGIGMVAVGSFIESRGGGLIAQQSRKMFNVAYFAAASIAGALLAPVGAGISAIMINRLGGGLIELPATGWGLAVGIVAYVFAMDFGEYVFHRLQHALPTLWSMHSLHHSDDAVNISTTTRHFWAEHLLKMLSIYLCTGLIFKTNFKVIEAYGVFSLYNFFVHMNISIGFGSSAWVLNSPLYHRLHHSSVPEHYGCNFAALFPCFDVLFGTYRRPHPSEVPPTGLPSGERPLNLAQAMLWPARHLFR